MGRIVQIRVTASNFGRRWDWQTLKEFGGGTLNNTGPHFIDLVMQLFGEDEPDQVYCHLDRTLTLGDADDHVSSSSKARTPTVDMEMSAACAFPGEFWHIMGTKGGLTGTLQALHWRVVDESKLAPRIGPVTHGGT
ncbi:MAG: Gfo/Idh/MocA family oxidoreductase [Caldilineaceae bacterium]